MKKLLHIDPHQRPTACQVLLSPWIMNRDKLPTHQIQLQESYKIKVIQIIAHVFILVLIKSSILISGGNGSNLPSS